jgi:cold shock protein
MNILSARSTSPIDLPSPRFRRRFAPLNNDRKVGLIEENTHGLQYVPRSSRTPAASSRRFQTVATGGKHRIVGGCRRKGPLAVLVVLGGDPYCARSTLETEMPTGTVKWFNPTKGYGFIQPSGGGGRDVFVHISAVERAGLRSLNEGQTVEYEIESNRGKESATNLRVK